MNGPLSFSFGQKRMLRIKDFVVPLFQSVYKNMFLVSKGLSWGKT